MTISYKLYYVRGIVSLRLPLKFFYYDFDCFDEGSNSSRRPNNFTRVIEVSSQLRKPEFRVFSIVHLNIYNF